MFASADSSVKYNGSTIDRFAEKTTLSLTRFVEDQDRAGAGDCGRGGENGACRGARAFQR